MSNGDDQEGDETRELRERAGRLLDELADSGGASRAVAFRMRALLSEPLSPARLEAICAALESTADEVRSCVAKQWLRFGLGRDEGDDDMPSFTAAMKGFKDGGWKVTDFLVALAKSDTFRYQKVKP